MMTPEDVLLEAMSAAVRHGNTHELRVASCRKLTAAIREYAIFYMKPQYDEQAPRA